MTDVEHTADQPSWNCRACHEPWPCRPARDQLRQTCSPTTLAALMWTHLEHAALELPSMPVGYAFDRFIRWTWRPEVVGKID